MAQVQSQSIPRDKFLLMAVNLLARAFIQAPRTDAKRVYREMAEGRPIQLATVEMEDKSTARFDLSLDHGEFRGKLNYGAFRASLATLLGNITAKLQEEGTEVSVFTAGEDPNNMIFGVNAVTIEEEQPNVLVLGADTGMRGNSVMLKLMYLDPEQFEGGAQGESELA